jgi:hypothetical protein
VGEVGGESGGDLGEESLEDCRDMAGGFGLGGLRGGLR